MTFVLINYKVFHAVQSFNQPTKPQEKFHKKFV